jgi:hypothetical protein
MQTTKFPLISHCFLAVIAAVMPLFLAVPGAVKSREKPGGASPFIPPSRQKQKNEGRATG